MGLAFPPFSLPWLLWLAWPILWQLAQRTNPYRPLYWALLLWNLIGCYWLTLTALSAPDWQEALLSFLAGALAITVNPLLMLLPLGLTRWIARQTRTAFSAWLFVAIWGAFEYLHFRWELTWSWLSLGFAWSEWSFWRQLGTLLGPVGLSVWSLGAAALLVEPLGRWRGIAFGLWVLGFPWIAGIFRPTPPTAAPRAVWVLQPNIDPYVKFSEMPPEVQLQRLLDLLPKDPPQGALIVGPETALPLAVSLDYPREEAFLRPLWAYVQRHQVNLLLGVVGRQYVPPGRELPPSAEPLPEGGGIETYNAALLFRPDTFFVHRKKRLVPFVERVPYLEQLRFLKRWNIDLGGGFGNFGKPELTCPLPLYPDELPVVVAICYESIFAHDLRERTPPQLALLAILTNDGWWKKSSGYWQHYTYGRLVGQSLGLLIARSANTGVSALIDNWGKPLAELPYDTYGERQARLLPTAATTLYYRWGEFGVFFLSTFAGSLWLIRWFLSKASSRASEK